MDARAAIEILVSGRSHALAGPFASTMLVDYGATEIIKLSRSRGDHRTRVGTAFMARDRLLRSI